MSNIFDSLQWYAGKWAVTGSRAFSAEEKASVVSATVVDSQYGCSVCFHMNGGGQTFIPLSTSSALGIGDSVDLNKAKLLTLSKAGEADINRVEV